MQLLGNLVLMKYIKSIILILLFFVTSLSFSQYTDVINSNRPGQTVSAYAVGKNVIQGEFGIAYDRQKHDILNTESTLMGLDVSLRYGLLFEQLEINWEASYTNNSTTFTNGIDAKVKGTDFSRNRLGLKYLVYDPFKNSEKNKPNLYSWRANHKFQWKNLLPAVSIYAGANFVLGDNPFFIGDPTISPRVMIATQSRLTPRMVLISNIAYDRIGSDFPEKSYIVSVSHALRNPKWSVFLENQGIQSDRYSDLIFRTGTAYLFNENFQVDFNIGTNTKNTPSRVFATVGASYRIDKHKDKIIAIEDQKANENGGAAIKKNSMKKKKRKKKSSFGDGAEDVDLGPTKKQLKKAKKKVKKEGKQGTGVIDF